MLNGVARLVCCYGGDLKDDLFKEKLGNVSIKELSRTARDRRASSLGYSEAMLLTYNKKSTKQLPFSKLYSTKGPGVKNFIAEDPISDIDATQMELSDAFPESLDSEE